MAVAALQCIGWMDTGVVGRSGRRGVFFGFVSEGDCLKGAIFCFDPVDGLKRDLALAFVLLERLSSRVGLLLVGLVVRR